MRSILSLLAIVMLAACTPPANTASCPAPDGGFIPQTRTCVARVTEFAGSSVSLFQEQTIRSVDNQLRVEIHGCEYRTQLPQGNASFSGTASWIKDATAACAPWAGDFTGGSTELERRQGASAIYATLSDTSNDQGVRWDAEVVCVEQLP